VHLLPGNRALVLQLLGYSRRGRTRGMRLTADGRANIDLGIFRGQPIAFCRDI
jgi:hypothetical protein